MTIMLAAIAINECIGMTQSSSSHLPSSCKVEVQDGAGFFRRKLLTKNPHFVQFKIKQVGNEMYNVSGNVFEPLLWTWTFGELEGPYPFIFWNIDYGILSFHLLETRTVYIEHELVLNVTDGCNLTYGSYFTTMKIVEALTPLIDDSALDSGPTYEENYFCHYQVNPKRYTFFESFFVNKLASIEYNCTSVFFNYTSNMFVVKSGCHECLSKTYTWLENPIVSYIIGVVFCLYCLPIMLFRLANWLEKKQKLKQQCGQNNQKTKERNASSEEIEMENLDSKGVNVDDDWIYLDGVNYPYNLSDALNAILSFLVPAFINSECCKGFVRRSKRVFLLLPMYIFLFQIYMYKPGVGKWDTDDKITITKCIDFGIPMGFLSMLDHYKRADFIRSIIILCVSFFFVAILVWLPYSWKQIIDNGVKDSQCLSKSRDCCASFRCFTFSETMKYSRLENTYPTIPNGYEMAIVAIQSRFYTLFAPDFREDCRKKEGSCTCKKSCCQWLMKYIRVGFYVFYYGVPLISFIEILVKGLTECKCRKDSECSKCSECCCSECCGRKFILYPQIAFKYIAFFTVASYYIVDLIQKFSDQYMEFLTMVIKVSQELDKGQDFVYDDDGQVAIFSRKFNNIRSVKINDQRLDLSQNTLTSIKTNNVEMVRERNGFLGIPNSLFENLVREFRPPHLILFPFFWKTLVVMCVCVLIEISSNTISGPTNSLSDVIGLTATVLAGALPELISSLSSHTHDQPIKEIKERQIKRTIIEYWQKKEPNNKHGVSVGTSDQLMQGDEPNLNVDSTIRNRPIQGLADETSV
ncbi:hypothetical protein ACF0H5_005902 [Mactra antiquata]